MEAATEKRKQMTYTDAIIMMVDAVNKDSLGDFYRIAEEFAKTLSKGGGNRYRILGALRQKPPKMMLLNSMPSAVQRLLIQGRKEEQNVFLTEEIKERIEVLLVEWNNAEVYKMHNIGIRNKILLHGPSGNGKTTLARHIASLINLPFVEINSDLMVDSHLGATSANIHKIFNDIKEPCILFWDEVDTIGRKRGTSSMSADTENDRMVNSILVNLEKLDSKVIFIGATNRMDILDSAFVRRFDVKLEMPSPSADQKKVYAEQLISYYGLSDHISPLSSSAYSSYSDIKLHVTELGRAHLLSVLKETQPQEIKQ